MREKSRIEPEPRLPIKLDSTSNGEFHPVPLTRDVRLAKALAMDRAEHNARRLGMSRRAFLATASGAATTLLCMNRVFAARGRAGGYFEVSDVMGLDPAAAADTLSGDEFILDVQTHHVEPTPDFVRRNPQLGDHLPYMSQARCGEPEAIACLYRDHYIQEVFVNSDTTMALLSTTPPAPADYPLTVEEAAATRAVVERIDGSPRLLIHGVMIPNLGPLQAQLDNMQRFAEDQKVDAWKCYTPWGPDGIGWWLDDPTLGIPAIEKARELGIKIICAHKGLPILGFRRDWSSPRDIGVVAKMFPDTTFMVYHAGFDPSVPEGPYDPENASFGVNALIKSLADNGIPPNSNVYADLGSTWRQLMKDPTAAAHVIGKLFKFVGPDRVVWGTDAIWYGSPQDQIQAFRTFQISEELQERYGYPALTDETRKKVFGLNAAAVYGIDPGEVRRRIRGDAIEKRKSEGRDGPGPSYATWGPRTRRQMLTLVRERGGWLP